MSSHIWKEVRDIYGTQFLFDGLNEISHRWKDEDPFYDFLNTIIRSIPNVIIMSRPPGNNFSPESFNLDLETIDFTVDQVFMYIRNCVKNSDTVVNMERLIAHKPLIRGLLRIPIQLDAFCYTWHEECEFEAILLPSITQDASGVANTDNAVTMTTLYQSITTELCKKDLRPLGKLELWQRPSSSEVKDKLGGELALLEEIAFHGLCTAVVEFNPQH